MCIRDRELDAREAVRRVVKLYGPALEEKHIELGTAISSEPLPILGDSELLHRALSNLVLNAMDAMPEGGTLTVSATRARNMVRISVADTGAGLTPEECERLFTPYYTTKQHGTGLGLAIVQSVVSDHGGTIAVDSEAGVGTTFRIDLPVSHREHHESIPPPAPETDASADSSASGIDMENTTSGTDAETPASTTDDVGAGTPAPVEEK